MVANLYIRYVVRAVAIGVLAKPTAKLSAAATGAARDQVKKKSAPSAVQWLGPDSPHRSTPPLARTKWAKADKRASTCIDDLCGASFTRVAGVPGRVSY
jgi:hypothetical protein